MSTSEFDPDLSPWRLRTVPSQGLGLIVEGLVHDDAEKLAPSDYVDDVLLTPKHQDAFFELVDAVGLVVCRNVGGDERGHTPVRARSSRGRLSQGEYYHHDGCSGPVRPRVVEIRCPYQEVERTAFTAIAPFPAAVYAMLEELPASLRVEGKLLAWHEALVVDGRLPESEWDLLQGELNRVVRRAMNAEVARSFLRDVDARVGAFREPWTMGESRFIANENPVRTMQHRRAYPDVVSSQPSGRLAKRWPGHALRAGA